MLLLTRRIGQQIICGDDIQFTIIDVRGSQVRVGVTAPKEIPVHRDEIYYRIKQEIAAKEALRGDHPQ